MWSNTRMVVLMALSAALYAALLIPFKFATVIPGLTEIRPGACVPVVTGILFGPAACWGSGLGNVIGDVVGGQFGPGSAWGFVGNFLLSYMAWKLWEAFGLEEKPSTARVPGYAALSVGASAGCALFVGYGVDLLGIVPFAFLAVVVFLNDVVVSLALGPLLLGVLLPRATRWGLRYRSIMDEVGTPRLVPAVAMLVAAVGGLAVMLALSVGVLDVHLLDVAGVKGSAIMKWGGGAFIGVMLLAAALL
jgi:energy-coupling factor transport system substrate-specific component